MDASKPTVLLVQGSFHIPQAYEKLRDVLKQLGYVVVHPQLPSLIEGPKMTEATLTDDALAVQAELSRLIEVEGRTVIVAMHSYGGLVGSQAIPQELVFATRQDQKLRGGVVHLFYFAAFILDKGQSVMSAFGESPNSDVKSDGRFYFKNGAKLLYNDLDLDEAALWESRLIAQSHKVQETEMTREAYRSVPATYAVCENDLAAPPQYQELFGKSIGAQIKRIYSGHSPMLSKPRELAQMVDAAARQAVVSQQA